MNLSTITCVCAITFFLINISFAQNSNIAPVASPEDIVAKKNDPNLANAVDDEFNQLEAEILSYLEPYVYDIEGRRDPFQPFKYDVVQEDALVIESSDEKEKVKEDDGKISPSSVLNYNLQQLRLKAILWHVKNPRIIVEDPNKRQHILNVNDKIGNSGGYIASVREGEVVVIQKIKARGKTLVYTKYMHLRR